MTLEARVQPYRDEIESNCRQMLELAQWLVENPHARDDLRREKFATWRKLERESAILEQMWDKSRDDWLRGRMNGTATLADVLPDVVRYVTEEV